MKELLQKLQSFQPYNEQEARDKEVLIKQIQTQPDVFLRSNKTNHISASAWVVNPQRTKVLMAYHNIYDSWSWLGGHADGDVDLLSVALREVREESGVKEVKPVREEIFSVEVLTVDGHEKHGKYVSSHLHLNVTYLLEVSEWEKLHIKEDENSKVAWFGLEDPRDCGAGYFYHCQPDGYD